MTDLTKNFNKISKLDDKTAIELGLKKLNDPDKLSIFETFEQQCAQAKIKEQKNLERERTDRITAFANRYTEQPIPELGTQREKYIEKREVEAMIRRGDEQELPLSQVTPASHREKLILMGNEETRRFEKHKMERLDKSQLKNKRKLVENLQTLDIGHAYDGVTRAGQHWGKDGKSLKDEFDRSR